MKSRLRPPAVEGLPPIRPVVDGVRIAGWTIRGLWHGTLHRESRPSERVVSAVALVGGCVLWPLLVIGMPVLIATSRGRFYMSAARDAVLGINVKQDGWHIGDHMTRWPGAGRGRALRQQVIPPLLAYVDEHAVTVRAVAATRELGEQYREEVNGLEFDGRAWPRGWRMVRRPHLHGASRR